MNTLTSFYLYTNIKQILNVQTHEKLLTYTSPTRETAVQTLSR